MSLVTSFRTMDRRLRIMLLATALLVVPQIGQFVAIRDINDTGRESNLAVLFMLVTIFMVPSSLILTGVIIAVVRRSWREHERLVILGVINLLIILNITWFFLDQCAWSQVFGFVLRGCHR